MTNQAVENSFPDLMAVKNSNQQDLDEENSEESEEDQSGEEQDNYEKEGLNKFLASEDGKD